jgi:phosphodiesterase/alkaline phosphatase D-like protein
MRGGQIDSRSRTELSLRKIGSVLQHGVLLSVVALGPVVLSGCAGLVSSASTGNPPPPSTLDITNVQAASATASTSQIVWTTNVTADSAVDYGTSTSYGSSTPVASAMVTSHQVTLSGLAAGTTYYYQVSSTDSKNDHGKSGGHTFKTSGFSI